MYDKQKDKQIILKKIKVIVYYSIPILLFLIMLSACFSDSTQGQMGFYSMYV